MKPRKRACHAHRSQRHQYETDEEGYLVNLADWNEDIANEIAKSENVELTPNHWEVVNFLRQYYDEYQMACVVHAGA